MNVYVVREDEKICGAFTDKNIATRMAESLGGYVEECKLNPELPYEVAMGYNFYSVNIWRHGQLNGDIQLYNHLTHKIGHEFFGHEDPRWWVLKVNVWAKTPQDAKEHADKLRQELIDAGKWE